MFGSSIKYEKKAYWNSRYENEDVFEWFQDYRTFNHIINPHMKKDGAILMLGCGNSMLSRDMYVSGYTNITNVDYSDVCIHHMAEKHKDCPGMKWHTMDIRELTFQTESFEVVIEKGTLDALLVSEKDRWQLSESSYTMMENILNNIRCVLKPGGKFISITFEQPHFRKRLYARTCYGWNVDFYTFGESGCMQYFVYVMTCGQKLSSSDQLFEANVIQQREQWLSPCLDKIPIVTDDAFTDIEFLQQIDL